MKALIPAAGLGTRFLPATKVLPKELLPVLDKPVIQYVVEEALAPEGVDECIIINSHEKPQIEEYFSPDPKLEKLLVSRGKDSYAQAVKAAGELPVSFVYQKAPLGLGHAVHCAAQKIDGEPFFVLLGDYFVPDHKVNEQMAQISREHGGASVIAVAQVPEDQVSRYGIIAGEHIGYFNQDKEPEQNSSEKPGAVWKLSALVEKPKAEDAPSHLYIVGRYLLSPRIMELLGDQTPGAGNEIQLTDAMERLLAEEEIYALVIDPKEGCDTGTPAAWAATCARMALERPEMAEAFKEGFAPFVEEL